MAEKVKGCGVRINEDIVCKKDMISVLPEDLLVTILSLIPTKEALSTMILSKRWRFIWTMVPILKLYWSGDPIIRLPKSLYTFETLEELTISDNILVDVPFISCLPSLTSLALHDVVYKDESTLVRLLSSCPLLMRLDVKRNKDDDNVTKFIVKVPTLLCFTYDNSTSLPDYDRCLVMDTPELNFLYIMDNSSRDDTYSVENNMHDLDVALIVVENFNFVASLSSVVLLHLLFQDDKVSQILRFSTIKFSWLCKCALVPCDSDWVESLEPFLHNTPKLRFLIIDYGLTRRPFKAKNTWGYSYPECLSSSLEKFKLVYYRGSDEETKLVEYILERSWCLKKVSISLTSTLKHQSKERLKEELEAIPRVSIASKLSIKNFP